MKRRLDLAMTLMGNPRIVFLDEPTSGVDPRGRRTMWQIVGDLVADGITIFLTTQYLEEADELANRIALLDHGRIVAEGTPAQLKRLVPGSARAPRIHRPRGARARRRPARRRRGAIPMGSSSTSRPMAALPSLRAVLDQLDGAAADVADVSIQTPDLDDVFLSLTGQGDARKAATE